MRRFLGKWAEFDFTGSREDREGSEDFIYISASCLPGFL
jgi:hypothetical protein